MSCFAPHRTIYSVAKVLAGAGTWMIAGSGARSECPSIHSLWMFAVAIPRGLRAYAAKMTNADPELPQPYLGRALRQLRLQHKLSQTALASAARVNRSYLSQIERGIVQPTISILYRLAIQLTEKASRIVGIAEDMAQPGHSGDTNSSAPTPPQAINRKLGLEQKPSASASARDK